MNKSSTNVPIVLILVGVVIIFSTVATVLTGNKIDEVANITVEQPRPVEATFVQDGNNRISTVENILVDGFPPEITEYPNSKLEKSTETVYNNQTHYSATWKSSAPVRKIVAFFVNQAKEKNWEIRIAPQEQVSEQEEQMTFVVNNNTVNVTAEKEGTLAEPTEIIIDVIPR